MVRSMSHPIVQKYGGSSLATTDKIQAVARKVIRSAAGGRSVVVVVSAMGETTTELIERARAVTTSPSRRELDVLLSTGENISMALLAMAIESEGCPAVSLTGPQCGITTDGVHANATIVGVRPERVRRELRAGRIVIVAGFQGRSAAGDVTTLGRGGSDTTAVALAGALGAARCEIYSDVPGVYSGDPRIVAEPMHLSRIDARLMTEYSRHGARVLHPACIELARRHGVPIHALATFGDDTRTVITEDAALEFSGWRPDAPAIAGVTSRGERVRVIGGAGSSGRMERALRGLIGPNDRLRTTTDARVDALLDVEDMPDLDGFVDRLESKLRGAAQVSRDVASVSFVAAAPPSDRMRRQAVSTLRAAGVRVLATYRRPLSLTCAIEPEARLCAVRAWHESLIEARASALPTHPQEWRLVS